MSFSVFPAIDLKDGAVVRLRQGDMARSTVFGTDPAAQAAAFAAGGAQWLHVVDLDGAFAGRAVNAGAVAAILAAVPIPVQLGGGIRDMAAVERWLAAGIARVILGSAAARDPEFTHAACRAHPGRIAIGIDARDGFVATQGWAESTTLDAVTLARAYEDAGAAAVVFTDIGRDGMLGGPNIPATAAVAAAVRAPVIASGGVTTLDDLHQLRRAHANIAGAIVGRALYDGRLALTDALQAAA